MAIGTAVADRFELIVVPQSSGGASFAQDVAEGLRSKPKHLS